MNIKEFCETFHLVVELKTYERTCVGRTSEYPLFDTYLTEKRQWINQIIPEDVIWCHEESVKIRLPSIDGLSYKKNHSDSIIINFAKAEERIILDINFDIVMKKIVFTLKRK